MLVLMLVIAVFGIFELLLSLISVQQCQHFLYDCLKASAQVLAAVGFSKWRDMNESRVALAQVQRRVVGVITQVSDKDQSTDDERLCSSLLSGILTDRNQWSQMCPN